jgi:L-rhamnose mutarotase
VQRVCFVLQVTPGRLEEYKELHRRVWPEMRQALSDAGWHRYSLFLREDGLLVGYLETDDFEAAKARMAATEVNARWQSLTAPLFEQLREATADQSMAPLEEVFHLD